MSKHATKPTCQHDQVKDATPEDMDFRHAIWDCLECGAWQLFDVKLGPIADEWVAPTEPRRQPAEQLALQDVGDDSRSTRGPAR